MNLNKKYPQKAKTGEQCNQCGQCCITQICKIGKIADPEAQPPCPQLGYSEEWRMFGCRLVTAEAILPGEKLIAKALGIGQGCDSGPKRVPKKPKNLEKNKKDATLKNAPHK